MVTLLSRVLHDVTDPAELVDPQNRPVSTHDFFAVLRIYKFVPLELGSNRVQQLHAARDAFDLTPAQRADVGEWYDAVDAGKDLHLFEAAILCYQHESLAAAGRVLTRPQVKSILGLTSD